MGLLGGSIAKELVEKRMAEVICGIVRRKEVIDEVTQCTGADIVTDDVQNGIKDADIVVLAIPVDQMESVAHVVRESVKPTAIITDVGSVKGVVVEKLEKIFQDHGAYIGSHPMAGKEKSGIKHAEASLFYDATVIVTPTESTQKEAVTIIEDFWSSLGAKVMRCNPCQHDRVVAAVSHLPHVVSAALLHTVTSVNNDTCDPFSCTGPSFRDMTRIASSSPEMWAAIMHANKDEVIQCIDALTEDVLQLKNALINDDKKDVLDYFASAKQEKESRP